jgi:signal transduction histidine kinase
LVLDLLDFSSIEAGQVARDMEPLEIKDVLEDVLDLMKVEAAKKTITINLDLLPEIPKIRGDKEDLIRLFMNLVSNAIKYNHPNGRVTLQVSLDEFYLVVAIHDTGIGISEKEQSHIFREFFRVNNMFTRKVPGTGLGLSIAKKIAEAHYGYVSVMSESGKGSTFSVYLPLLSSGISQSKPQTHY